jgi:hypothetical protein
MMRHPIAYLGFLPLIPYIICLYVAYRMPHVKSGGFWLWIVGWVAFGLFTLLYAIARTRVVLHEAQALEPMDWTRFGLVLTASCCLLIFVLSQRWSFPNVGQTLRDDIRADAHRLWRLIYKLWRP